MIDLGKLRLFYIVAQEGSVSKAAQRLNTSQPALSEHIINFEHRLKVKLFKRTARGMQLTAQGERLFEHAHQILTLHGTFEEVFYEQEEDLVGDLEIITFPYLGSQWLVPALAGFLDTHPRLDVQIHLDSENILPIQVDVAIGSYISNQPRLIQKELFPTHTQLFASPQYLEKYGVPEKPEDLEHHRLITYRDPFYYSEARSTSLVSTLGRSPEKLPRKPCFQIDSLQGMVNAALQGYGIAELMYTPEMLKQGLRIVLPEIKGRNIPVHYIFQRDRKHSRKINALYEHLRQQKDFW